MNKRDAARSNRAMVTTCDMQVHPKPKGKTMATTNIATWTKTSRGWQTLLEFKRSWEAPAVGSGLGEHVKCKIVKRNEYESRVPMTTVKLTSRVFNSDGKLLAFCEEVT